MSDYLAELRRAIRLVHGVMATHIVTVPVSAFHDGQVAWEGAVEVFEIAGNPQAERCYAWGREDGCRWNVTTVLGIPPVISPETAVKVSIIAHAKHARFRRN